MSLKYSLPILCLAGSHSRLRPYSEVYIGYKFIIRVILFAIDDFEVATEIAVEEVFERLLYV